jgi:hypothetical protein
MNKNISHGMIAIILNCVSFYSFSQNSRGTPRWVSEKGYWVVESNIHSPKKHIIRFYNNENSLVYTETLTNVKLNPYKRKTKMKLKKILESSVVAREKQQTRREEGILVNAILK